MAVGQREGSGLSTPNTARKAENDSQGAAVGGAEGWKIVDIHGRGFQLKGTHKIRSENSKWTLREDEELDSGGQI